MNSIAKAKVHGAKMRLAQHYVDIVVQLGSVYSQGFENSEYALAAFDAEQEQIESWFDWLVKQSEDSDEAAKLIERFLSKGFPVLQTRITVATLLEWYERGLEIVSRFHNPQTEAEFLINMGSCAHNMGQKDHAEALLNRSKVIAREIVNQSQLARSLYVLAYQYQETGRYPECRTDINEALALFREIHDAEGIIKSLRLISWVAIATGDLDLADQCNQEAYELGMKTGDYTQIGMVLALIGSAAFHKERLPEALDYFKRAFDFAQRSGRYTAILSSLVALGAVASTMEDYPTAEMYMLKTIQLAKRTGLPLYTALTLCNLGDLQYKLSNFDKAIDYLEQGIIELRALRMDAEIFESLTFLVAVYGRANRYTEAYGALREGLEMAQQLEVETFKQMAIAAAAYLWLETGLQDENPEQTSLALQWFNLGNVETLQIHARPIFEARMPEIEWLLGKDRVDELIEQSKQLILDEVCAYILSVIP